MKKFNERVECPYMYEEKYNTKNKYFTAEDFADIKTARRQGARTVEINGEELNLMYMPSIVKNPDFRNPEVELKIIIEDAFKKQFHYYLSMTKDALAKGWTQADNPKEHGFPVNVKPEEWHYKSVDGENPVYDRWLEEIKPYMPKAIAKIKRDTFAENPLFGKRYQDFKDEQEKQSNKEELAGLMGEISPRKRKQDRFDYLYSN